jgi:hypothetical protein
MKEAAGTSEALVNIYHNTPRYNLEDNQLRALVSKSKFT